MNRAASVNSARGNQRFVILAVVLGLLGAVLVYVAFSRDSGGTAVLDTPVVVAKQDIPARTRITQSMLEVKLVNRDARSLQAFSSPAAVVGQVTRFPIAQNEQVLETKLVAASPATGAQSRALSFIIPPGKRAVAVKVTDVAAVGGLVLPGDYVDVLVVYDVEFPKPGGGTEKQDAFVVQTLLQNVEVLAVAQTVVDVVPDGAATNGEQRARNSEARPNPEATTVTLSLNPEDAARMYLAEMNGKVRLTVRRFGDADQAPVPNLTELELLPRNLPNPFTQR